MIQRIQSLWLFLAAVALFAVLFLPVGKFVMPHGLYECTAFKMTQAGDVRLLNLPIRFIGIVSILAGFFSLLALLHFKKRDRQIRWAWVAFLFTAILALGIIGLFVYFKYFLDSWVGYGLAVLMPFLGLIFNFLAIIGIKKDDALVKSLDRIR
jgi:D-alanyl-lipoteichoic acid acyltransferase DltB (MBOAT superfamily)